MKVLKQTYQCTGPEDAVKYIQDKTGRNLTESERHIVEDAYGHLALEISLEGASHPLANASAEEYFQEVMERFNKKTEE